MLREQAQARGLLSDDVELSPEIVFSLVRDMPYRRASSREPEVTIQEWRGTCSGKHYLLKRLFEELGFDVGLVMCTHVFTEQNTAHFPEHLRVQVSKGPIPDVHTFVRLRTPAGKWVDVDATWPLYTRRLGMPVNDQFQVGVNMRIACDPMEILELPGGVDPQSFKEELIKTYCGPQIQRRDHFIEEMSQWLVEQGSIS
jgi:hypothetical protein